MTTFATPRVVVLTFARRIDMDALTQKHIDDIAEIAELHAQRAELVRQRDVLRDCLVRMMPKLHEADQWLGLCNKVSLETKAAEAIADADAVRG